MSHTPQTLNIIGLGFDIAGAVIVAIYGVSYAVITDGRGKNDELYSRIGMGLLILGFVLQLASNLTVFWA